MSIAIKKQALSKKEQEAKNRLLGRPTQPQKQSQNSPPTKDVPDSKFKQVYEAPTNDQIDKFLKNVENDFQQISQKQVTMGMLSTQQELIRQQNEILMRNQQQLQQFVQTAPQRQGDAAQVNQFMALLAPINQQLGEIKQLYQQTRQNTQQLEEQMRNNNVPNQQSVQQYQQQSTKLQNMLEATQNNLQFIQPENLDALRNFTDFNLRLYQDTINNLQSQIVALQNEALTTEQELNVRYKQLSDARLGQKIKQGKQFEEETLQKLHNQIGGINFDQSKQYIHSKLGGEMDYDQIVAEVEEVSTSISNMMSEYQQEFKNYEPCIPEFKLTKQEQELLNAKPVSILDDLKEKYGIRDKPPKQIKPVASQPFTMEKASSQSKPGYLQQVPTKPTEPPKEIKFQKQQIASNYKPLIEESNSEKKKKLENQAIKKSEVKKDKLVYRSQERKPEAKSKQEQQKQQVQERQKNFGVIQYLNEDNSFEEQPEMEIIYKPPKLPPTNKQTSGVKVEVRENQVTRKDESDPRAEPRRLQYSEHAETQIPSKNEKFAQAYSMQNLKEQYQELAVDPKFVNYDQLINQAVSGQYYGSEEQKGAALLERLGIKQEQPKNEYELIELLSRDIIKEKLKIQQTQKQGQVDHMRQQQGVLQKSQSVQIQPEAPSVQEQVAQGAQAFFQGLLQAFNTTLVAVNQGIAQQATVQRPSGLAGQQPNLHYQYEYEESEYSEEEQQKQQQQIPFSGTQTLQQYTFAQNFQAPQKKPQTVDLKEYYKQFEIESQNSQITNNKSGESLSGTIFRLDDSYGQKSEGQVSISDIQTSKFQRQNVTKDIFAGLNNDLSDGEVQIPKKK